MQHSTIAGNHADSANGDGGGIFAQITNDITNATSNVQALTVVESLISGNSSGNRGGGIFSHNNGGIDTLVQDSRITGNHAESAPLASSTANGGGLYLLVTPHAENTRKPKVTITGTTLDNNTTDFMGGGLFICVKEEADFIMVNSTVSENHALRSDSMGGGMVVARYQGDGFSVDAFIRNVTITENQSAVAGGLLTKSYDKVRVRLDNCIISGNHNLSNGVSNFAGPLVISESFNNLVGTDATVADSTNLSSVITHFFLEASRGWIFNDDPKLGTLKNNGGPLAGASASNPSRVPTHALLVDSPAFDAGSNDWATVPLSGGSPDNTLLDDDLVTDQRGPGFPRIAGARVDIGAYEVQAPRIIDVRLSGINPYTGADWTRDDYSFAELVAQGKQFAPIFTDGVNKIEIVFSEDVHIDANAMKLYRTAMRYEGGLAWRDCFTESAGPAECRRLR